MYFWLILPKGYFWEALRICISLVFPPLIFFQRRWFFHWRHKTIWPTLHGSVPHQGGEIIYPNFDSVTGFSGIEVTKLFQSFYFINYKCCWYHWSTARYTGSFSISEKVTLTKNSWCLWERVPKYQAEVLSTFWLQKTSTIKFSTCFLQDVQV